MDWTVIIAAVIGSSVLTALVSGYFQSCKIQAEADAIKVGAQTASFATLTAHLEARIDKLHMRVEALEADIEGRDMVIAKLTSENEQLHKELKILKAQNERLMKTNLELSKRVKCLEEKLTKIGGEG